MRQVIAQQVSRLNGSPKWYNFANLSDVEYGLETRAQTPWSLNGTLESFRVSVPSILVGQTYTFRLYKNGVAVGSSTSIAYPALTALHTDDIVLVAGNKVSLEVQFSGAGPAALFSIVYVFNGDTPNQSGYTISKAAPLGPTTVTGAAFGCGIFGSDTRSYAPISGRIVRIDTFTDPFFDVPAPGDERTFNIVINGVVQDGTGGTVNTTLVVDENASLSDSKTFSCPFAITDDVRIRWTATNCVAGFTAASIAVISTEANQAMICGGANGAPSASVTNYVAMPGSQTNFHAVEADIALPIAPFKILLKYLFVTFASNVADGYEITLRKNLATPVNAPTVTVINTAYPQVDTNPAHVVVFNPGDLFSLQTIPQGGGTLSVGIFWSFAVGLSAAARGAGIYKLVPNKTNDTIYETQDPVDTQDFKIPNPYADTFLIGDE